MHFSTCDNVKQIADSSCIMKRNFSSLVDVMMDVVFLLLVSITLFVA